MTDYKKLVAALRCENTGDDECGSSDCPYWSGLGCMDGQLMEDAADAIEALQAQLPKRGEWVDGDARRVTARCSVCGLLRLGNGAEWANKHVHFCEVCGSRMGDEKA